MFLELKTEQDYIIALSLRDSYNAAIEVYEGRKGNANVDLAQHRKQIKQNRINRIAAHDLKFSKRKAS